MPHHFPVPQHYTSNERSTFSNEEQARRPVCQGHTPLTHQRKFDSIINILILFYPRYWKPRPSSRTLSSSISTSRGLNSQLANTTQPPCRPQALFISSTIERRGSTYRTCESGYSAVSIGSTSRVAKCRAGAVASLKTRICYWWWCVLSFWMTVSCLFGSFGRTLCECFVKVLCEWFGNALFE